MVAYLIDYKVEWRGCSNFWSGRDGNKLVAIVDHIMQGTMESTDSWFKNRRSDASSHFGVALDGRIWQWVKEDDAAWGNGIPGNPDTSIPWIADCTTKNINYNNVTISIEHEGFSGKAMPDAQYYASLWLHRYLCSKYNIQPNRQYIIGHYQIDKINRAACPGNTFPWNKLMSDLAGLIPPVSIPVFTPPVDTPPITPTDTPPVTTPPVTPTDTPPVTTPPVTPTDTPPVTTPPSTPPAGVDYSRWIEGVTGVVYEKSGPHSVLYNNTYVRLRPSISSYDGTLLRTLSRGATLNFVAYTDLGPVYQNSSRWYLISDDNSGGWVNSRMVS
ncbi:MAG: N-acetylmuramoyl-L-alanine amidase [Chloroflexi bacterium]|uniref:N-acetylmuramoyl-L-alanine amidase n=1 Tax=Candidatus Chlorohelix allophototropha TaxID=3003348 RepID=A0A8T7M602_9CHLR|nr:N-acetylmuramoyl-L-alanine amidase [Chloroflexota bacterium]WJW69324.1 N-acetylmuramoyl-L-alanine amidase [Chloroflexota bacterium L227-S17]